MELQHNKKAVSELKSGNNAGVTFRGDVVVEEGDNIVAYTRKKKLNGLSNNMSDRIVKVNKLFKQEVGRLMLSDVDLPLGTVATVKTVTHPFQFLKTVFNFSWSSRLVIFLVMQTTDNSMRMVWRKGITGGRMKIDNSGQRKVPAFIPIGQEVMERYARKVAGVPQNILLEVFFDRPTTAHILGGCPMSDTRENGVVDNKLKVHGYPDFYITDGSVVQGNIGVNPSLTIAAMAEYCMSRIPSKNGTCITDLSQQLILMEEKWKEKR